MITPINSDFVKEQVPAMRVHSHGGAAASYVLLADKGFVESLIVMNNTGTAGFVQIHDALTLPSNGVVPIVSFPIPADGAVSLDTRVYVGTGAVVAISTTRDTLTISANTALFYANVTY